VIGVQELPQQNAASADLRFNNTKFEKWHGFYKKWLTWEWDGSGKASLKHYSDGRWVLDTILIPLDLQMGWSDLNIEVR
jgi:hypothetical protein